MSLLYPAMVGGQAAPLTELVRRHRHLTHTHRTVHPIVHLKMSDDDFMLESDNEDYEFDYEDNSEEESPDVDIENKYYNAKQIKATDPGAAIGEFLGVVSSEKEKGDWWVFELLS